MIPRYLLLFFCVFIERPHSSRNYTLQIYYMEDQSIFKDSQMWVAYEKCFLTEQKQNNGRVVLLVLTGTLEQNGAIKTCRTNLTWQPFWPGRLRCPDVCRPGWQKTHGHCCWSLLCWSTPIHQMEAGSWCGGQPTQDHKTLSTNHTGINDSSLCVHPLWWQQIDHLLPGQSDHVQRAVHKATRHNLLEVFCEHCVIYTVVCSHVLSKEWKKHVCWHVVLSMPFSKRTRGWEKIRKEFRTVPRHWLLLGLTPTLIFTWVLLRSHFSRGLEGVNSDTSFPSSSRMLEFSCLMTYSRHLND